MTAFARKGQKGERTTWAVCPTCNTLFVGVAGRRIVCIHSWEGGRITERKLLPRVAARFRGDGGFRF